MPCAPSHVFLSRGSCLDVVSDISQLQTCYVLLVQGDAENSCQAVRKRCFSTPHRYVFSLSCGTSLSKLCTLYPQNCLRSLTSPSTESWLCGHGVGDVMVIEVCLKSFTRSKAGHPVSSTECVPYQGCISLRKSLI